MQLSDTLGVSLGTGIGGAIIAAGAALGWTRGNSLTIAFTLCAVVAVFTAFAAVRLPALVDTRDGCSAVSFGSREVDVGPSGRADVDGQLPAAVRVVALNGDLTRSPRR